MHVRLSSLVLSLALGFSLVGLSACAENSAEPLTAPLSTTAQDAVVGSGKTAETGKTVSVNYRGTLAENGQEFDNSYDRGEPFRFKLGAGQVIEGWDKGVVGMKVGGKRTLLIPPEEAYGANGVPGAIPPNATLKFEIELLDVQ